MNSDQQRWLIVGGLALAAVAIAAVLFLGGNDDEDDGIDAGTSSTTTEAETTTTSEAETTTTSEAETTTTSEAETTTTEEATTTSEAETTTSVDDGDTLTPITVEIDGEFIVFENDVECTVGPGVAGEISGTADDDTTIEILLDGEASTVAIDGASGTYDAMVTEISNDEIILTIEAEPPAMEISVAQAFCQSLEESDS